MRLKKESSNQKLKGAYYTPIRLSDAIVKLFAFDDIQNVLEPSCGDGSFLDSLDNYGILEKVKNIDAVEIEREEAIKTKQKYNRTSNLNVYNEDFFDFYKCNIRDNTYDLILGNPPYIRYQYLNEDQREKQSQILVECGMKANKLINTWVAFMVACIQLLSARGKLAFIIPAEILQVAYAEELRGFLLKQLSSITIVTFNSLIFSGIEQEVVVFVGEKKGEYKGIRIVEFESVEDFANADLRDIPYIQIQESKDKWTKYFASNDEVNLIEEIQADTRFTKFSNYATANVGITTGNNEYFAVTDNIVKEYNLKDAVLPLVGRSSHVHGIRFTEEDWTFNVKNGKRAYLIRFPDIPFELYPENYKKYIMFGKSVNADRGFKCSIRDKWYIVPSTWSPDAFFLRRNNFYPKFVLNSCGAVSTDVMHRIMFYKGVNPENVLLAYYNSISFSFTEICGRSYGGGVLEILPGEIGNIMLPKLDDINPDLQSYLLRKIDYMIRDGNEIETILDLVDNEILINCIGVSESVCRKFRTIWKKMQQRRLKRK